MDHSMTSKHGLMQNQVPLPHSSDTETTNRDTTNWPSPNNPHEDINHIDSDGTFLGCLCDGVSMLSALLREIYTEDSEHHKTEITRIPISVSLKLQKYSMLMTPEMAHDLYTMLPETCRISTPSLAFATYRDGWSMHNLHAKCFNKDSVVVLLRTLRTQVVIGAYSTVSLSPPSDRVKGNGECFVFRLSTPSMAYRWTYLPSEKAVRQQFVVSSHTYIAFGASNDDGSNALRIDSDLKTCDSGFSDTFQSKPLAPEEAVGGLMSPFEIQDIEILHIPKIRKRPQKVQHDNANARGASV